MKPITPLIYLLLISIIILGCFPKTNSPTPSVVATATLQATSTSPVKTKTPTPKVSIYEDFVELSLAAVPTLESDEAFSILNEFLQNKPPCQLPCWWGITPGISKLSDAHKQFTKMSGISDDLFFAQVRNTWIVGVLDIDYPLENTVVRVRPAYLTLSDDERILRIGTRSSSLPLNSNGLIYGDKEYNAFLSAYTINQILATYGLPNLIYTRAEIYVGEPTAPDYFIIRLLYLDRGIFIDYEMPIETKENTFEFCPSESLINLELIPQNIGSNYQEFFRQIGDEVWASIPYKTHDQPTEKALGLTNEEFSRAIISSPETCFETPIDIWPEP